jgi:dihydrodipicolinate synthase/N-acetylneuraminate lyase
VVSGAACAAPEVVVALARAQRQGAADSAEYWRGCLNELLAWSARFPQPTLWKVATELRGLKTGPVAAALSARKQRQLAEFREWFRCWLVRVRNQSANA